MAQSQNLQNAIANQDDRGLRRAMAVLNDILGREPSKLNTRLVSAAGALRLVPLETAMSVAADELLRGGLTETPRSQLPLLTKGASAIASIRSSLGRSVETHNIFQEIDDELRLIELRIQQGAEEVRLNCQWVIAESRQLAAAQPAGDWSGRLDELCAALEAALEAENEHRLRLAFGKLRSFTILRFRQVDRDLLGLCDSLKSVGEQATQVLSILQERADV